MIFLVMKKIKEPNDIKYIYLGFYMKIDFTLQGKYKIFKQLATGVVIFNHKQRLEVYEATVKLKCSYSHVSNSAGL